MSKLVYVAGPYTSPDPMHNTRAAIEVADHIHTVSEQFLVPIIPHLSAFWDLVHPHPYQHWLDYDLELLARCDVLYRMGGDSSGADHEVSVALKQLGLPVYYDLAELFAWGRKLQRVG